ncbi:hypothetical protein BC938DRAFT_475580, partial [Jimgerdemannia flammicorona]
MSVELGVMSLPTLDQKLCAIQPEPERRRFSGLRGWIKVAGHDANAKDNDRHTPLHYAAPEGHVEVARLPVTEFR